MLALFNIKERCIRASREDGECLSGGLESEPDPHSSLFVPEIVAVPFL
jgi:hypothetical protein